MDWGKSQSISIMKGEYMKSLLLIIWMGICTAFSSQENFILVQDTINGVTITYPVEIDMDAKREYERLTKIHKARLNGVPCETENIDIEPVAAEPVKEAPTKPVYMEKGFVFGEDAELVIKLKEYLDLVPFETLLQIGDYGYTIRLVEKPDNQNGICGVTLPDTREIQIQATEEKFRRSVVHEVGHAYDHTLKWVSESPEFISIFDAEKDSFVVTGFQSNGHHKSNVKEYFAEAFQMYIYDSETLQVSAPQTYEFIKSIIKE